MGCPLEVVETAVALQSDLARLDNELRGRLQAHSQSGNSEHDQEAGIEHSPEASVECDLEVDTEFEPEVHTGNALGVSLRNGQEPKLKIIVKLIPKMNRPIPKTITRNPK